jgi:hypothetical protein
LRADLANCQLPHLVVSVRSLLKVRPQDRFRSLSEVYLALGQRLLSLRLILFESTEFQFMYSSHDVLRRLSSSVQLRHVMRSCRIYRCILLDTSCGSRELSQTRVALGEGKAYITGS